jgi:hypothetical protein
MTSAPFWHRDEGSAAGASLAVAETQQLDE